MRTHQQAKSLTGAGESERRSQRSVGRVWVSEEIEGMSLVQSAWRKKRWGTIQESW